MNLGELFTGAAIGAVCVFSLPARAEDAAADSGLIAEKYLTDRIGKLKGS